MVRRLIASIVLCGVCWLSRAESKPLAAFPFEFRDGLMWVRVQVQSSTAPLNFLLDSGASVSVINLSTARKLGLKLAQRVEVRGVGSASKAFWPQQLTAKAGNLTLPGKYLAVDLSELSRACACGVDGLIGADFFRDRVTQIDFGTRTIRLLSSSEADIHACVVDLRPNRGALLAAVGVNSAKPQWMRVDTGCASALQWVANAAKGTKAKGSLSVGLTELDMPTTTTAVTVGSITFDSVPTGLHCRPIFDGESGLLGNGLLSRFERVTIDTRAKRLVLEGRRSDS